jgi:hypothetical protein
MEIRRHVLSSAKVCEFFWLDGMCLCIRGIGARIGGTRRGDACLWKGEEGEVNGAFRTREMVREGRM